MLQPTNLHLFIGGATPGQARIIDLILREEVSLKQSLILLSRFWKLKIWFSEPVSVLGYVKGYGLRSKITTCHVFSKIWELEDNGLRQIPNRYATLRYAYPRHSWQGILLPDTDVQKITRYEILLDKVKPIWS
jgi:hypothetical protein